MRRLVHVSSLTVHGNNVGGKADENSPLRTEPNPYSRSKVAGEKLLQRMIQDEGAPVTIVRPGWIYGPGDTASFGRIARMIDEVDTVQDVAIEPAAPGLDLICRGLRRISPDDRTAIDRG